MANRMSRIVSLCNKAPSGLRVWLVSTVLGANVKLVGTTRARIEKLNHSESRITIRNLRRNRNHIGTVHACAMALTAETATGFLIGMNTPDTSVPVIKSMNIDFVKRSSGDITCEAHITDEQIQNIRTQEKGELTVACTITDGKGVEPIKAEMIWAWTPKRRT
ncbi:DUF4442 domain-containing protein [Sansalvadorimonas sp. 2012CJ34-2]|uniref:DUF4442 domain-containing protein n=1 Tax=Parendozoicomonas callyspongiae TaxID=2942213 RepID=A0ABT0PBH8_9GAMM|nr:DUF4442 domain-containing protein [Sansalvadorimonas sp. 2012CJ34-2]MCL6268709.1 DUF4442 domain-containing protein [Sansalvadorimonas sp. 2012CJ34-2]